MSSTSPDIFLSYNRDDQAVARRFAEGFEREGFSVWWDVTLKPGADYDKVTEDALRSAKAVVVLWSKKSVESRWVRAEATEAASLGTLVPVMIEPCKRPIMFELKQSAELAHWQGETNDPAWKSLVAGVRRFTHKDEAATTANPSSPLAANPTRHRKLLKFGVIEIAALVVVIALDSYFIFTRSNNNPPATTTARGTQSPSSATSLAVLPFSNLSDDKAQDYFSDGLTDELINKLSNVSGLQVTGRNSSFYFKGRNDDLIQIGQKLGVEHVLQGSVRKSGSKIRISAQLMEVAGNRNLWSQTYDTELTDIFSIQDEIAGAVTTALSITLRAGVFSNPGMTGNIEAYDALMQGDKQLMDAKNGVGSQLDAIALWEKAVRLDPKFAVGWSRLAYIYRVKTAGLSIAPSDRDDFPAKGQHALAQAEALVPNDPTVQLLKLADLKDLAAEERAIKSLLDQGGSTEVQASLRYAALLWGVGRPQEALRYAERATRLEPLDFNGVFLKTSALMNLNRLDDAETTIAKVLASGIAGQDLTGLRVASALQRGDKKAAVQIVKQYPNFRQAMYQIADAWEKNGDAGAKTELLRLAKTNDLSNSQLTAYREWTAALGDTALSLELMRKIDIEFPGDIWFPLYSDMRKLPGFKDWVRERGLFDYWRNTGNWGDFCRPIPNTEKDFECH